MRNNFLHQWIVLKFSSQLKHSPFFLLSCILLGLNRLIGGVLFLAKFVDGNGGGVGSKFIVHLASIVVGFLAYLISNNRARLMASVMDIGQVACTSVLTWSFNPLIKHPS